LKSKRRPRIPLRELTCCRILALRQGAESGLIPNESQPLFAVAKFFVCQRPSAMTKSSSPTTEPMPAATLRSDSLGSAPDQRTRMGRIARTPSFGARRSARKSKPSVTYAASTGSIDVGTASPCAFNHAIIGARGETSIRERCGQTPSDPHCGAATLCRKSPWNLLGRLQLPSTAQGASRSHRHHGI
jgi:hypothetical protein